MYDEIGNLIEDKAEQITNIKWSVYGKILEISRNATPKVNVTNIKYTYDALGNRISKEYDLNGTKQYFWYVRDAQGNLLGTYKAETETVVPLASLDVNLVERHIYGSSRLGMYALTQGVDGGPADMQYYTTNTFTRGRRQYELSNHLGNVLITLSDRKFGVSSGGSLIDYYEPDMLAGNDYYPFGMLSRVATSTSGTEYRFGFNGKEHDSEAKGWQNQVDYGMRVYDPRIGRFLSVDPLQTQFAYWTPYQYAGNTPIWATDLDGAESILRLPRWMIPEPVLTLPKLPPVPVQPVPPIPPAIPTGFSTPQSPMIPPGPYMPTPPGTAMKPTVGTQNLPRTSTGEIDWDAVGEGIDMTDTQTWPEPPFTGEWKEVDPPAGTKSAEKATELGHKRLQNEQGDIIGHICRINIIPSGIGMLKRVEIPILHGKIILLMVLRFLKEKFLAKTFSPP